MLILFYSFVNLVQILVKDFHADWGLSPYTPGTPLLLNYILGVTESE